MDNTTFIFDGVKSTDMGLSIIKIDGGFYSTPYISGQDIIEDIIPNKNKPYFYKTQKRPLEFELIFSTLDEEFTEEKRFEIARWLIHDEYKEFQSTDYIGKIFNVIAISDIEFMSGGTKKGYFSIRFRCDAPWAWSPTYINNYNLSGITQPTIIQMTNKSNIGKYYYPEIQFELQSTNTSIKFKNFQDGGREFEFTNLEQGEIIYVDNENRRIISNEPSPNQYRLGNFNKKWLRLIYGVNNIEVTGKCKIQTRMKFPIYM